MALNGVCNYLAEIRADSRMKLNVRIRVSVCSHQPQKRKLQIAGGVNECSSKRSERREGGCLKGGYDEDK